MSKKGEIRLNFREISELSADMILDLLETVSQSNHNFELHDLI